MDRKTHPDPSPHEVDRGLRATESGEIDDVFASASDSLDRVEDPGLVDEGRSPDLIDRLDHAGLDADYSGDDSVPGGVIEEQVKGVAARWGKAGP